MKKQAVHWLDISLREYMSGLINWKAENFEIHYDRRTGDIWFRFKGDHMVHIGWSMEFAGMDFATQREYILSRDLQIYLEALDEAQIINFFTPLEITFSPTAADIIFNYDHGKWIRVYLPQDLFLQIFSQVFAVDRLNLQPLHRLEKLAATPLNGEWPAEFAGYPLYYNTESLLHLDLSLAEGLVHLLEMPYVAHPGNFIHFVLDTQGVVKCAKYDLSLTQFRVLSSLSDLLFNSGFTGNVKVQGQVYSFLTSSVRHEGFYCLDNYQILKNNYPLSLIELEELPLVIDKIKLIDSF